MEAPKLIQKRKQKGYAIAQTQKVVNKNGLWQVPSQSNPKQAYTVELRIDGSKCTCRDYINRGVKCKHIFAVELTLEKTVNQDGSTTITATKRITYPQNWSAYTKAQNEEVKLFDELLKDLVQNVDEPQQVMGRPRVPLREGLFCAIQKVYSQLSSRRAYSLYKNAEGKTQISRAPNYNVINYLLNDPEITPLLKKLLEITAMPLKSVETQFAIDSTGFRTTKFGEYCHNKYPNTKSHHWLKAHLCVGTKTNIVTSVEITTEHQNDTLFFAPLLNKTSENGFNVQEISADKAYSSRANYETAEQIGAMPYIPFKSNAVGNPRGKTRLWRDMFFYFQYKQEEFMEHYHKRSNVETTNMAIKTKFGDCLKNKNFVSQTNELLCKLIAYNITVLINAIYELKINPELSDKVFKG
ncbi:MAG: transposase [Candidatus Micrarchaeales archaeon]|nr:transposase [Candidatus Micrarchaeales archaeon]